MTPASPFQLPSMSNWEEYTQQNHHSRCNPCGCSRWLPFKPVCHQSLKNGRSGPFWRAFGLNLAQMKQRLFVCLRSSDHGADLSRRVASVSGNLWLLATDLWWLTLKGKSGGSHLSSPWEPHQSRFPHGSNETLNTRAAPWRSSERNVIQCFAETGMECVQNPNPNTCYSQANSTIFSQGERDKGKMCQS